MEGKILCEYCIYSVLAHIVQKNFEEEQDSMERLLNLQIDSFYFGFSFGTQKIKTITEGNIVHVDDGNGRKVCDTELVELFKKAWSEINERYS